MKFTLKVTFADQSHNWDLQYDDETCKDESFQDGKDANDEMVIEDFFECVSLEIIDRQEEEHDNSCPHCRGTGIGQHGDPATSCCSFCGGSGTKRYRRQDDEAYQDYLADRADDIRKYGRDA